MPLLRPLCPLNYRLPARLALSRGPRLCLAKPNLHLSRHIATSQAPASENSETKAVEETEDVNELDRLLKVVRKNADPHYNSVVPLRGGVSWTQALLDSASAPGPAPARPAEPRPPRPMHDSYTEILLPFRSDPELLEQYTNASGGIRTGKLLEHLDSLAGSIAYKHVLGPAVEKVGKITERGFYIVTASVDRMDMLAPLTPVRDLRLSGQVICVGKSSIEVAVKMEALDSGAEQDQTLMLGRFSMVCRDAFTHRAYAVNPLDAGTPEEAALRAIGQAHRRRRQTRAQRSLALVPPSSAEARVLHAFSLAHANEPLDRASVWMGETRLERTMLMFPQERNVHQKIFGGYLMRLAYELGFTTARLFTRQPVRFVSLDNIAFARPVPIGSILRLTSGVLHTDSTPQHPSVVHVRVKAEVVDVETGSEQQTNDFRFTWGSDASAPQRRVVPRTYREAMLWLEGRRALEIGAAIQGLRASQR